ncbi:alpha-1,2-fucosyltransferase [Chitinophaga flava]|uniref:Alpha-1,2-fucosyltransferase n=1 Tax=Chitinophaga flava TaxID=2259036 RepID=A0A365XTV3_9BACT|nr:alpha-1,2-fucosyltransferase [Chitinophaga flava]RBL89451.1 hypothetical protein DF182_23335 [Chitinophaga flava]
MIVIRFKGGIGNQMFQYAFGRFLSLKYKVPLYFNKSYYNHPQCNRTFDLDIFRLGENILQEDKIEHYSNVKEVYELQEDHFHFNEEALHVLDEDDPSSSILITEGYWQSYKYFESITAIIREDFQFRTVLSGKWLGLAEKIRSVNAVMINVRRGDYLNNLELHGVVSAEYISRSILFYDHTITDPFYFVFSDDIPWCKAHINQSKNVFFVTEEYYDAKFQFYLQLMINCKHFIISNSSFAWWAAWLCQYEGKTVIYPRQWFAVENIDTKDLTPPSWIAL